MVAMMRKTEMKAAMENDQNRQRSGNRDILRRWLGLAAGLALLWTVAYVILPWGNKLPYIEPIMQAIEVSGIDAGPVLVHPVRGNGCCADVCPSRH
jgi:hypothetical protein